MRLAPIKSVIVLFLHCTLLYNCPVFAQSYLSLHSEVGLSAPIGVSKKESNLIYDNNPIISNWQALHFTYILNKNLLCLQLGGNTLGYSSNTTQGFTPSPYISSGPLGPGLPIDLKVKLRTTYATLGIGYGRSIGKKVSVLGIVNYLKIISVKQNLYYTFPDPNIFAPLGYTDSYEYQLTKGEREFEKFADNWAATLQFKYSMSKHFFLCGSYLLGLKEFSPYNSQPDTRDRFHQNFGLGLEYRFKL